MSRRVDGAHLAGEERERPANEAVHTAYPFAAAELTMTGVCLRAGAVADASSHRRAPARAVR